MEQKEDCLSSKDKMVGPHTKNGILKDGKRHIRMESNEEPMER
jgi:hypothetical protein